MSNIWVEENWIDITDPDRRAGLGGSGVYESRFTTAGEAYKGFQELYGRCTGKVYIDRKDASPLAIGWVFVKRENFEDVPTKTYLCETWVTLHSAPDDVVTKRTRHYLAETEKVRA